MAYDRYVAICSPLHYKIIMTGDVCSWLAAGCWAISSLDPIPHTVLISQLTFCGSHTINHFFCDVTATMKLSCTSTNNIETLTYLIGAMLVLLALMLIFTSYIKITIAILRIQSAEGRQKAFSTCVSHITVVILFMGSLCSTYMRPTSKYSMKESKMLSLLYVVVTPLCNPIIYSFKNTDFKNVLWKKLNTSGIKN
ncbi:olfactory receptor 5V1-like [Lissotriton helveticus]